MKTEHLYDAETEDDPIFLERLIIAAQKVVRNAEEIGHDDPPWYYISRQDYCELERALEEYLED